MDSKRVFARILLFPVVLLAPFLTLGHTAAEAAALSATRDSWIDASRATRTRGTDSKIRVRSSGPVRRALVGFDVSSIPSCATVTAADLQLTIVSRGSSSRNYNVHRLTESWTEGGVSWNLRDGLAPWTSMGGRFSEIPTASAATGRWRMSRSPIPWPARSMRRWAGPGR